MALERADTDETFDQRIKRIIEEDREILDALDD